MTDAAELLAALIACRSITPATDGVMDVLERALTPLGFAVTRLTFDGGGSYPVENLFATRGQGGRHLLFAGHTDVVPPGDEDGWSAPPFAATRRGGAMIGRGAVDMKGGIAAFIAALDEAPQTGRISLAITNDEEADAVNGTARLIEWAVGAGQRFDFAIVGEPSSAASVGDSIKIGRRGSLNARVTVRGTQGHVAYPERANNPLPVLAALAGALHAATLDEGSAHFPPSNLELTSIDVGNLTTNVIPAAGHVRFNIRYNDRWTPETLTAWLGERIAAIEAKGTEMSLEILGTPSRSFLSPLDGAVEVLERAIAAETGRAPERSTGGGTSDARFIAPHCPVVELGLVGSSMHKTDEAVPLRDLDALRRIYARFLGDYLR